MRFYSSPAVLGDYQDYTAQCLGFFWGSLMMLGNHDPVRICICKVLPATFPAFCLSDFREGVRVGNCLSNLCGYKYCPAYWGMKCLPHLMTSLAGFLRISLPSNALQYGSALRHSVNTVAPSQSLLRPGTPHHANFLLSLCRPEEI